MKQSELFYKTQKEIPSDADSINASYLVRAGFVQKHMAGAYAFLPLGLRIIHKIEDIVREEMNAIGGQELRLNVLQPKELWEKTGRWESMDDVLYKCGGGKNQIAIAATHEEQITQIVKSVVGSYKDLPLALYQIQTKFRNEPRAKSGLLRGREFQMKDMYSFHFTDEDFTNFYDKSKTAYLNIFQRLGLKAKIVEASGGQFTDKNSHEFQVFTEVGEDTIFYCDNCDYAVNKEITEVSEGDKCPNCDGKIKKANGIEVGNIFPLETKYSKALGAKFTDKEGGEKDMVMGCYGIGISRAMATVIEVLYNATENKMVWPKEIAPFEYHLISLRKDDEALEVYNMLRERGVEVLFDNRDNLAGEKFAEADLIGVPNRIIISDRSMAAGGYEIINAETNESNIYSKENLLKKIDEMRN